MNKDQIISIEDYPASMQEAVGITTKALVRMYKAGKKDEFWSYILLAGSSPHDFAIGHSMKKVFSAVHADGTIVAKERGHDVDNDWKAQLQGYSLDKDSLRSDLIYAFENSKGYKPLHFHSNGPAIADDFDEVEPSNEDIVDEWQNSAHFLLYDKDISGSYASCNNNTIKIQYGGDIIKHCEAIGVSLKEILALRILLKCTSNGSTFNAHKGQGFILTNDNTKSLVSFESHFYNEEKFDRKVSMRSVLLMFGVISQARVDKKIAWTKKVVCNVPMASGLSSWGMKSYQRYADDMVISTACHTPDNIFLKAFGDSNVVPPHNADFLMKISIEGDNTDDLIKLGIRTGRLGWCWQKINSGTMGSNITWGTTLTKLFTKVDGLSTLWLQSIIKNCRSYVWMKALSINEHSDYYFSTTEPVDHSSLLAEHLIDGNKFVEWLDDEKIKPTATLMGILASSTVLFDDIDAFAPYLIRYELDGDATKGGELVTAINNICQWREQQAAYRKQHADRVKQEHCDSVVAVMEFMKRWYHFGQSVINGPKQHVANLEETYSVLGYNEDTISPPQCKQLSLF